MTGGKQGEWGETEEKLPFLWVLKKRSELPLGEKVRGLGGYTIWMELQKNGEKRGIPMRSFQAYQKRFRLHSKQIPKDVYKSLTTNGIILKVASSKNYIYDYYPRWQNY